MSLFESVTDYLDDFPEVKYSFQGDRSLEVFGNDRKVKISLDFTDLNVWKLDPEWLVSSPKIIASKVINELGLSHRIYARKCAIERVSKPQMEAFLKEHHLNGVAGAKHKIGLMYNNELVAIATFAAPRQIDGKRSAGLIRFCGKSFCSISGGLNKLINHYIIHYPCDDIFTYVNVEYGDGKGFEKVGFQDEGIQDLKGKYFRKYRLIIDRSSFHQRT